MVKQGILITPVLGEVLTNLAPLRMKHSASVPAYHKGNPTWLFLYLFACALTHLAILTLCLLPHPAVYGIVSDGTCIR